MIYHPVSGRTYLAVQAGKLLKRGLESPFSPADRAYCCVAPVQVRWRRLRFLESIWWRFKQDAVSDGEC